MRAIAPGKLVLTGAYAVLDGAPAIVMAVDRYAIADASRRASEPTAEVRAAFGVDPAPEVDVRMLQDESGTKLGLGSSAAALVASLAARALDRGQDLSDASVRDTIFRAARHAHAQAQGGGSGIDVAAAVYGGVQRYAIDGTRASVESIDFPRELVLKAYFAGESARTSDLLARVRDARRLRPREASALDAAMFAAAVVAAESVRSDGALFIQSVRQYGSLLSELGGVAGAPIVPASCAELATFAASENAAFLPSGAGGGDVAVWLGVTSPSARFEVRASALGLVPLELRIDHGGVRLCLRQEGN
jgi:phosphomevalonate kinase